MENKNLSKGQLACALLVGLGAIGVAAFLHLRVLTYDEQVAKHPWPAPAALPPKPPATPQEVSLQELDRLRAIDQSEAWLKEGTEITVRGKVNKVSHGSHIMIWDGEIYSIRCDMAGAPPPLNRGEWVELTGRMHYDVLGGWLVECRVTGRHVTRP
jgi:hypothetical protein